MSTIKPFEIIMRPYLWDMSNLGRPPKCPYCLGEVTIVQDLLNMEHVSVLCKQCAAQGPEVRVHETGPRGTPIAVFGERWEAAKRWNQLIERIYHLAHGVIPAPSKKED